MADQPTSLTFRSLMNRMKPGLSKKIEALKEEIEEEKEVAKPTTDERVAVELMQWARSRAYREVFLPEVVEPAIDFAKRERYMNIVSHPLNAYWTGYEKALEDLKERFVGWQTGETSDVSGDPMKDVPKE